MITTWRDFFRWRVDEKKKAYDRGYAWALAELACGANPERLAEMCDGAIDRTDFDRGALAALREDINVALSR